MSGEADFTKSDTGSESELPMFQKLQPSETILPALTAVIGIGLIAIWLQTVSPDDLQARVSGRDGTKGDRTDDTAHPLFC